MNATAREPRIYPTALRTMGGLAKYELVYQTTRQDSGVLATPVRIYPLKWWPS